MEGVFANMPYKSVETYEVKNGKIEPVIHPIKYDEELYDSMQRMLPEFAKKYASLELRTPEDSDRLLYEFALEYYNKNLTDREFAENIGELVDSIALYGKKRAYAPPYTLETLDRISRKELTRGAGVLTTSISMSVARSDEDVQNRYFEMYQILPGDSFSSGRLLSAKEQAENKQYKKKYAQLSKRAAKFCAYYNDIISNCSVEDKILFVTTGKSLNGKGLDLVERELQKQNRFVVKTLFLTPDAQKDYAVAEEVATAKYILAYKSVELFCLTKFRDETKEIMLKDMAFPLYNQGLAVKYFLKWKQKYNLLAAQNDVSILQIPSPLQENLYRRNYCRNAKTTCDILGCCNTDLYYDPAFSSTAKDKLLTLFPAASGKKIILYMPTWRTRKSCPDWISMLEMDVLHQLIGAQYAVVINFNPDQRKENFKNIVNISGFCREIPNSEMAMRELMAACDIIVGDYRDSFFETALLHKPAYSTAYDYENFICSDNLSMNAASFEKYLFCPIVRTAAELAEQLAHLNEYDYAPMEKFRADMLAGCDGHSVDRIIEYLMQEE